MASHLAVICSNLPGCNSSCRADALANNSALANRNPLPFAWAGVARAGADEAVVVELLDDVGAPADDAADDKQRRVKFDRQAEIVVAPGARPIEVRRQLFLFDDDTLNDVGHLLHVFMAGLARQLGAKRLEIYG